MDRYTRTHAPFGRRVLHGCYAVFFVRLAIQPPLLEAACEYCLKMEECRYLLRIDWHNTCSRMSYENIQPERQTTRERQ